MKGRSLSHGALILTAVAIFLSLPLYGQTPTPPKASDKPKTETKDNAKGAKTIQSHTQDFSPPPALVFPKQSEQGTPIPTKKQDDYTSSNWWLVGVTGALVCVGIVQVIVLCFQSRWMRRTLAIAQRTAEAAKIQAEIMEKEYALKNRAKIHVRDVVITNLANTFQAGEFPGGRLNVINAGGNIAEITNIGAWFEIGQGKRLPTERPDEGDPPNLPNPQPARLEAGHSSTYDFTDSRHRISDLGSYNMVRQGNSSSTLYAMGYVDYVDTTRISRRTTFFREYRLPKGKIGGRKEERRFFPVDDPRYEYEE